MGVDLSDLAIKETLSMESLSGKIIAVDAYNMLYQFLASIRQEDGTPLMDFKGRITAHLSGLFYRSSRLVGNGIKPVFVFDGPSPSFKRAEKARRKKVKKEAEQKWKEALEEERFEDARKYAQATSRLTKEMVEESKHLLDGLGIPWVQAPSEGEAQAAVMTQKGITYATSSQDYDALLFGSPVLIRNLSITGKRKVPREDRFVMVHPEQITLSGLLKSTGLSREQLILLGIMAGTDFNEGVYRVGPKTALKIVKEVNTIEKMEKYIMEKYNYQFEINIHKVFDFFLHPPYKEVAEKLQWGHFDKDSVINLLVQEHDFSEERVTKTLDEMMHDAKEKGAQKKLDQFFG
jgi:flap endonuclease-1